MLNPSLKSRFMEKFSRFSRILAGLVGYKNSPLENKKRSKNKKTLKNAFFIKIIKNVKNVFLHLCLHAYTHIYTYLHSYTQCTPSAHTMHTHATYTRNHNLFTYVL